MEGIQQTAGRSSLQHHKCSLQHRKCSLPAAALKQATLACAPQTDASPPMCPSLTAVHVELVRRRDQHAELEEIEEGCNRRDGGGGDHGNLSAGRWRRTRAGAALHVRTPTPPALLRPTAVGQQAGAHLRWRSIPTKSRLSPGGPPPARRTAPPPRPESCLQRRRAAGRDEGVKSGLGGQEGGGLQRAAHKTAANPCQVLPPPPAAPPSPACIAGAAQKTPLLGCRPSTRRRPLPVVSAHAAGGGQNRQFPVPPA